MENTNKRPVDVLICQHCDGTGYMDKEQEDECPLCEAYGSYDYATVARMSEIIDVTRAQVAYYRLMMPAKRETRLTMRERRAVDEQEVAA